MNNKADNSKAVSYNKWGYIFLIPFLVVFIVFQLIPLATTIYNSFFECYRSGLKQIGPDFIGLENYIRIFKSGDIWVYFANTMIMWFCGFVPQIFFSLLFGAWFSDTRLRLRWQRLFKTIIYMPNLIMASAFAMLFFTLFADSGPVNSILVSMGILSKPFQFFSSRIATRGLISFMTFIMWFGNTTLLLLAGMLGIDNSLYEAAQVDGATPTQVFFKITLPILKPILLYVVITSLIGGLQLFDIPQVLTDSTGDPGRSTMTLVMWLNRQLFSKNYGMAGAISVIMFIITGILSMIVFRSQISDNDK